METQNPNMQPPVPNNTPNGNTGNTANSALTGLEGFFDTYLRVKAPFALPTGVKEFIVKYGPWITLVLIILAAIVLIPLALLALGLSAATTPYAVAGGVGTMDYVSIVIGLVVLVMEAIAIPKLLKRQLGGWKLIYYASLLSALNSLLNLSILSLVLGLLIGMYVLFQIREYYK